MAYALYRGTRLGLALQEALGEMEEYEQISPNVRTAVLRKFDEVQDDCTLYFIQILTNNITLGNESHVEICCKKKSSIKSFCRQCVRSWRRRWTAG